jgi:ankyrin repeat protein
MEASRAGDFEMIKWLLTLDATRASINTEDKSGKTALQLAIEEKEDACATLLRKHGAE